MGEKKNMQKKTPKVDKLALYFLSFRSKLYNKKKQIWYNVKRKVMRTMFQSYPYHAGGAEGDWLCKVAWQTFIKLGEQTNKSKLPR